MERWSPPVELSRQEQALMKRLTRVMAPFGFLRLHRHELFDETFQEQLERMHRQTGAGEPPHPPALMCMVTLLQGYVGASDAEELGAAEKTIKVHRGRVMEKLGVGSVAELVRLVDRLEQGP
ncbi:LuxR C-terminal-related transcriptional regulator [Sorangium sp. So ce1151]